MKVKSIKILSVVGTRPEFIQSAPVTQAIQKVFGSQVQEVLVHTGQHYDYLMSQAFFDELGISNPKYNLNVHSRYPGQQVAAILERMEKVLALETPDLVLVRGDTNSTLAAALAASKAGYPIVHIEAGERSYDLHMPEEVNRTVTDRLSILHFCASRSAVRNLRAEGISASVFWVGDVMLDAFQKNLPLARKHSMILSRMGLQPGSFALMTIHRAANTDNPLRLERILAGVSKAVRQVKETVIFPVHPRTLQVINQGKIAVPKNIRFEGPVSYYDMLILEINARLIATDSGGVQREAYFSKVPALIFRDETEWTEIIEAGWARLVGDDLQEITENWFGFQPPVKHPSLFGNGKAAKSIAVLLREQFCMPDDAAISTEVHAGQHEG